MPVTAQAFVASAAGTADVLADLGRKVAAAGLAADFVFAFYGANHDDVMISDFLAAMLPGVPVVGGTSSLGLMSQDGLADESFVGLLVIEDRDGRYGAAGRSFAPGPAEPADTAEPADATEPADAAEAALRAALRAADAAGELPELIWLYQSPGHEERVLAGLQRVVGDRCPIIGGTAADNDLTGRWRELGPDGPMTTGVVVGVLFPSGGVSFAFQGGFEPTGCSGVARVSGSDDAPTTEPATGGATTETRGDPRHIAMIDDEPAAVAYSRWLGGVLPADVVRRGGPILEPGRGWAIGVAEGTASGVTYFRLIQAGAVSERRGLVTFADVHDGERLYGMRGSKDGLVRRAARVVSAAVSSLGGGLPDVAGGIVFYCAGCREAVGGDLGQVVDTLRASFGDRPFLGSFTDGEQGPLIDRNVHSNLMISAVVFGR